MTTPHTTTTDGPDAGGLETATLGGGCFWCLEAVYEQVRGVRAVVSGYAGGETADPTYEEVCAGRTGHAEVVRLTYDPREVSYGDLLRIFFTIHDPTTPDRQGADVGTQYRSIILYESEAQRREAEAVIAEIDREGIWGARAVTQVVPLERFYPAEAYHRHYYARNARQPYCRIVIEPKVAKFRQRFAERMRA